MPTPINVSAGSQAIIALGNVNSQADITGGNNAMVLPYLQDITVNNSTGVFRWKTLDSTAENAATTPATNSISMNIVVDETTFFGSSNTDNSVVADGIFGTSKNKTRVHFEIGLEGADSGDVTLSGSGFISGLAPTVNMDAPVWVTPITIEVDGDYTAGTV
tara:strand:+ start:130 stop:612 length:483 start_codon:yes stop_codon:yes gene_type:complete